MMDLKSMLNESVPKQPPPRLHTPQSSFDRSAERHTPYDAPSERPLSYPASARALDSRSPPTGYFAQLSPQQNSASSSTPSAGAQSIYTQSPGSHGQLYTPRDAIPPSNQYPPHYAPSPSSAGPPPVTPGSAYPYQAFNHTPVQANAYTPTAAGSVPRPPTQEEVNGIHRAARQMSPPGFTHPPQPVTPLGPPTAYHRPSPQTQRPLSQGYDHFRRSSVSSIGSSHSRDHPPHQMMQQDTSRADSAHRSNHGEEERQRERERSLESVSPKTIPRPTPQRQSASHSQEPPAEPHPSAPPHHPHPRPSALSQERSFEQPVNGAITQRSTEPQIYATPPSGMATAPRSDKSVTPQSTHSSLPAQPSPPVNKQSGLKRSNSMLSTPPATAMPPRKRPRRDEIPIFAQNARRGRPLRFNKNGPTPRPPRKSPAVMREPVPPAVTNGQESASAPTEQYQPFDPRYDPTVTNILPYEDLVRKVCDFVAEILFDAKEPVPGSFFEVEAKLGAIVDQETNQRIDLPVKSEVILDKAKFRPVRFASTMDQNQHKFLNEFLNSLVQQSLIDMQTKPNREAVHYKRERESDEFYELTPDGRKALPQALTQWLQHSRYPPKVRKTFLIETQEKKEQIIKARIADLEVFNPNSPFDYRISLSLEAPWDGEPHHLVAAHNNDRDRQKDRISYRHMYNQIDLTQISYPQSAKKEHELEVEISHDRLRHEFALLKANEPHNFEDLMTSFINNVRILCREAKKVAQ